MKHIILIQNSAARMGGVETLVARTAKLFKARSYDVTVLMLNNRVESEVIRLIPEGCHIVFVPGSIYSHLNYPAAYWHPQWSDILPESCDIIISFSPAGIAAMRFLRRAWFYGARELVYVVHPYMLLHGFSETPAYLRRVIESISFSAFLFMNRACRVSNNLDTLSDSVNANNIIPLPVDPLEPQPIGVQGVRRLVSIGRIEPLMKTYNWSFIPVFCELADKHDLVWDVYGAGTTQDVEEFKRSIVDSPCRSRIRFHGEIPENKIAEVLSDAFLFIGMGTALVQAASCGIPSLMAIAYEPEPVTYGWFNDTLFPCLGEDLGDSYKKVSISTLVEDLLAMNEQQVAQLGWRCREHTLRFSSEQFVDLIESYCAIAPLSTPISNRRLARFWISYMKMRLVNGKKKIESKLGSMFLMKK